MRIADICAGYGRKRMGNSNLVVYSGAAAKKPGVPGIL
jgi:hypothetical protein